MKKWLMVILLVLPIFIKAECNYNKHVEYMEFASHITYETEYSMSNAKFTVTFYNVMDGLYIKIGKNEFRPDANNLVVLHDYAEGSVLDVYIYANDGCNTQVGNITVSLPYYNPYYGTEICRGYEELTLCASNFSTTKPTKSLIEKTKENYDTVIIQDKNGTEEDANKPSFMKKTWDFFVKYISKAILIILSSVLTIIYYNNQISKIEHGI